MDGCGKRCGNQVNKDQERVGRAESSSLGHTNGRDMTEASKVKASSDKKFDEK